MAGVRVYRRLLKSIINLSIKNKILFSYTLIILFSLVILAYSANRTSTNAIIEQAKNNSVSELSLIEKNLYTLVTKTEDYSRILSIDSNLQKSLMLYEKGVNRYGAENGETPEKIDITEVLSDSVINITETDVNVAAVSVLSMEGTFFDLGMLNNSTLPQIFNKTFIGEVKKRRVPVWSGLINVKTYGGMTENVFSVSKLVIDKSSGKDAGIVILYVKESDIASIFSLDTPAGKSEFYILDGKGAIISATDKSNLYGDFAQLMKAKYSFENYAIQNGCKIFNVARKQILVNVMNFDKLGWQIVKIVPMEEVSRENKNINRMILVIGAFCILLSFAAAFGVSRSISRPVFELAGNMKKVESGNLDVRIKVNSNNELGVLQRGFNTLMEKLQKLISDMYKEQKQLREYEFKLLQSQIKPHFLYNSLETILSLVRLKRYEDTIETTKYLASFYRLSLSKGSDIIRLTDEIQLTGSYLFIQRMRYPKYIDYSFEIEDSLLNCKIPKLTLQPLVENAIYHGIKPKSDSGRIIIGGGLANGRVRLEVFDDGGGMDGEQIRSVLHRDANLNGRASFGLSSVNERIKLIYGDEYGLSIESEPGCYTRVIVLLPCVE